MQNNRTNKKEINWKRKAQKQNQNRSFKAGKNNSKETLESIKASGGAQINHECQEYLNNLRTEESLASNAVQFATIKLEAATDERNQAEFRAETNVQKMERLIPKRLKSDGSKLKIEANTRAKKEADERSEVFRNSKMRGNHKDQSALETKAVVTLVFCVTFCTEAALIGDVFIKLGYMHYNIANQVAGVSLGAVLATASHAGTSALVGKRFVEFGMWLALNLGVTGFVHYSRMDVGVQHLNLLTALNALLVMFSMMVSYSYNWSRQYYNDIRRSKRLDKENIQENMKIREAEYGIDLIEAHQDAAAAAYSLSKKEDLASDVFIKGQNLEEVQDLYHGTIQCRNSETEQFETGCDAAFQYGRMKANHPMFRFPKIGFKGFWKPVAGAATLIGLLSLSGCGGLPVEGNAATDIAIDCSNSVLADNIDLRKLDLELKSLTEKSSTKSYQVVARVSKIGEFSNPVVQECNVVIQPPLLKSSNEQDTQIADFISCTLQNTENLVKRDSLFRPELGTSIFWSLKNSAEFFKDYSGQKTAIWYSDGIEDSGLIRFPRLKGQDGKMDDLATNRYAEIITAFRNVGELPNLNGVVVKHLYISTNQNDADARNASRFWKRFVEDCGGEYIFRPTL